MGVEEHTARVTCRAEGLPYDGPSAPVAALRREVVEWLSLLKRPLTSEEEDRATAEASRLVQLLEQRGVSTAGARLSPHRPRPPDFRSGAGPYSGPGQGAAGDAAEVRNATRAGHSVRSDRSRSAMAYESSCRVRMSAIRSRHASNFVLICSPCMPR